MFSCYQVFVDGRLFAIVHTYRKAERLHFMLFEGDRGEELDVRIEGANIPGLGF